MSDPLREALKAARGYIVNMTTATHRRARLMDRIDAALAAKPPEQAICPHCRLPLDSGEGCHMAQPATEKQPPECGCEEDRCFGPMAGYSCRAEKEGHLWHRADSQETSAPHRKPLDIECPRCHALFQHHSVGPFRATDASATEQPSAETFDAREIWLHIVQKLHLHGLLATDKVRKAEELGPITFEPIIAAAGKREGQHG